MTKFVKPTFRIQQRNDCGSVEELIVRQMQNSDLHYFEAEFHDGPPPGYIRDWDDENGIELGHDVSMFTDGERGWLLLIPQWRDQPNIDYVAYITEVFQSEFDRVGIEVDLKVMTRGWDNSGPADIMCFWTRNNAAIIDRTFKKAFPTRTSETVNLNDSLDALESRMTIRDEHTLRKFWGDLDREEDRFLRT